jgi:KDO2-lipid IV(A) lauroyltransferase
MGRTLGEVAWLWSASPEQVTRICTISGVEHVEEGLRQGGGVVLFTGHCGNWEMLNAMLNISGIPMTIAVRDLRDARISAMATELRSRFGSEVVARGKGAGRRLAHALAENRVNGLLIDQDIRDIPGVFVPFFGRPAWTPVGGGMLAVRAGCPSVAAFIHRQPDGTHRATIEPLPAPEDGSEEERALALTARATAAIEAQIRAHPAQWVWFHRRWRTRPDDLG